MKSQKHRKVVTYKDYFKKFFKSQNTSVQKKIVWTLELIEDIDQVPETYLKHLTGTDGLYEVRVSISSNVYRIFCFFSGEQFGCSYERLSKEDSENAKIRNNKSIKNKRRV